MVASQGASGISILRWYNMLTWPLAVALFRAVPACAKLTSVQCAPMLAGFIGASEADVEAGHAPRCTASTRAS